MFIERNISYVRRVRIRVGYSNDKRQITQTIWFSIVRSESTATAAAAASVNTGVMELWLRSCTVAEVQRTASDTTHNHPKWIFLMSKNRVK